MTNGEVIASLKQLRFTQNVDLDAKPISNYCNLTLAPGLSSLS